MSWKSRANEHRRQPLPLTPLLFLGSHISLEQFYSFLIMSRAFASSLEDVSSVQPLCFAPAARKGSHQQVKTNPRFIVKRPWETNFSFELLPFLTGQPHCSIFGGYGPVQPHDEPLPVQEARWELLRAPTAAGAALRRELDKEWGDHYQTS